MSRAESVNERYYSMPKTIHPTLDSIPQSINISLFYLCFSLLQFTISGWCSLSLVPVVCYNDFLFEGCSSFSYFSQPSCPVGRSHRGVNTSQAKHWASRIINRLNCKWIQFKRITWYPEDMKKSRTQVSFTEGYYQGSMRNQWQVIVLFCFLLY